MAFAQSEGIDGAPTDVPGVVELLPATPARFDGVLKDFDQPARRTFALEFGGKLIELKGFYLEKHRRENSPGELSDESHPSSWGSYFDLAAVSSHFGGKLVGESEVAYSTLGLSIPGEQEPIMTRLGLKGNWGKAGYGLSYRSFGSGFVSTTGAKVDHARDEEQLWAEYDFGLFRLRGTAGETWEKNSANDQITLTRTAATSVALNRPQWNAWLSSGYSMIEQEPAAKQKTLAWTNGLALVFRPAVSLALEPNVGFKQEWDSSTGRQSDTTSAGFALSCSPSANFRLTGRASFSHTLGGDQLKQATTLSTTAGLNWNIGKTFLGEPSLSLQLDYINDIRPNTPDHSQDRLAGMIRFKLAGF